MGMIGIFRRLADSDLTSLLDNPTLVHAYLEQEEPAQGFGPFVELDVDKAWHGIHFLLTGTPWAGEAPWNFALAGGSTIGDEEVGYGPVRGFTSRQVRDIASALESLSPEELSQRFDPKAMMEAEIYPEIWDRPTEEDDTRAYLTNYYGSLRDFIAGAAGSGEALLVYLS